MLNWDYKKHNFSSIENTLCEYFPVQNHELYNEDNIQDFEGLKKIEEIIHHNFFTNKNYRERWVKFRKFLKQEFKMAINESMIAWYPCYSGFIVLQKDKFKNLTYKKELHFFISLLGPYYTIFGIDKSEVELDEEFRDLYSSESTTSRTYTAYQALTVSPYLEYKEHFLTLKDKILKYFPSLKYVPYQINNRKVAGISLLYPETEENIKDSVFSALFKPDNSFNTPTRGDTFYGYDEWLIHKKIDNNRKKEIHEGLLERAHINEDLLTIHKFWKLNSVTRIPSRFSGSITFNLRVLDLTDNNLVTIISEEDEEAEISKYLILENEIVIEKFKDKFKIKIQKLEYDELKLILHINLQIAGKESIHHDILEMKFDLYK